MEFYLTWEKVVLFLFSYLKVLCAFALFVAAVWAAEEKKEDLQGAEGFLGK